MTDQLRYNEGKSELGYWLATQASARIPLDFKPGAEGSAETVLGMSGALQTALCEFVRGGDAEMLVTNVTNMLGLCGVSIAFAYSAACTRGARKYARGNFRKGCPLSQLIDCAARHLAAIQRGEEMDTDSGGPHVDHFVWNVVQIHEEMCLAPERDDRLCHMGDYRPTT